MKSTVDSLMGSASGGTIALIIGIATALWSASAYVKAFGRVANDIYEVPEGRGPIRLNGGMLALTAALVLGILLILISVLLNATIVEGVLGPIAQTIGAEGTLSFLTDSFLPIWAWVSPSASSPPAVSSRSSAWPSPRSPCRSTCPPSPATPATAPSAASWRSCSPCGS